MSFNQLFFIAALAFCCAPPTAEANNLFANNVVTVNYDSRTKAEFGAFPNRAALATYVDKIQSGKPRSLVMKFFLDTAGVEQENSLLALSLSKTRTLLQARLSAEPPTTRHLDERFFYATRPFNFAPRIKGDEGWLPIKKFADKAAKVCFNDIQTAESIPMFEMLQNKPVESIYMCLLAEALKAKSVAIQSNKLLFNGYALQVDAAGEAKISLAE